MSFVGTNATHGNFGSSVNARHSFVCERAAEASIGLKLVSLASSAAPSTETYLCGILCCATVLVITFPVSLISSSFENSLPLSNVVSISPVFWKVWTEIQAWFHLVVDHKPKLCLGSFAITSFPQMVITNAEKDIAIDLKSFVQAAVDQTSRGLLKRTNLESDKSIKL